MSLKGPSKTLKKMFSLLAFLLLVGPSLSVTIKGGCPGHLPLTGMLIIQPTALDLILGVPLARPSHLFVEQNSLKNETMRLAIEYGRFGDRFFPCIKIWRGNRSLDKGSITESCFRRMDKTILEVQSAVMVNGRDEEKCGNEEITEDIRVLNPEGLLIIYTCIDHLETQESDEAVLIVALPQPAGDIMLKAQNYMSKGLFDQINWSLLVQNKTSSGNVTDLVPCLLTSEEKLKKGFFWVTIIMIFSQTLKIWALLCYSLTR